MCPAPAAYGKIDHRKNAAQSSAGDDDDDSDDEPGQRRKRALREIKQIKEPFIGEGEC